MKQNPNYASRSSSLYKMPIVKHDKPYSCKIRFFAGYVDTWGKVSSSFFPAFSDSCRFSEYYVFFTSASEYYTPSKMHKYKRKGLICYMIWMKSRTVAHAIAIISMVPNNLDFFPFCFYFFPLAAKQCETFSLALPQIGGT